MVDAAAHASLALEAARGQRADLHAAIVAVEKALAGPAQAADDGGWAARVHDAFVELSGCFERHIAVTEGPDGLFDEILDKDPRLAHHVDRLRTEHAEIRTDIAERLVAVRTLAREPVADTPARIRDVALDLITQLSRHRQAGADLVYEAYTVDVGGSG